MIYILLSIIFIILGVSIFVIRNLLKKLELLEDILYNQSDYLYKLKEMVDDSTKKIIDLDQRGIFSSDDEIGFFFSYIKQFQELLNDYISKNIKTL